VRGRARSCMHTPSGGGLTPSPAWPTPASAAAVEAIGFTSTPPHLPPTACDDSWDCRHHIHSLASTVAHGIHSTGVSLHVSLCHWPPTTIRGGVGEPGFSCPHVQSSFLSTLTLQSLTSRTRHPSSDMKSSHEHDDDDVTARVANQSCMEINHT